MLKIYTHIITRLADSEERGAVAIEYALLALLIAVALVVAMTALQVDIGEAFAKVGTALDAA
ncbi:MAG: Flp family type IVb pilin [Acidimicrobiia bacterium]|nr:Flp family type IVb pilin [Acidimicrobiia bacterium]